MSEKTRAFNERLYVVVDTKKERIRIHGTTMKELGDPSHIQVLVNPRDNMFALKGCDKEDVFALRISPARKGKCGQHDFYSKRFVRELAALVPEGIEGMNYIMEGEPDSHAGLVLFSLNHAVPLNSTSEVPEHDG